MHSYDIVLYAVTRNATCLQLAAPELKNNGGRESARAHPPTAARPLPACVIACGRPQPMRGLSPPYGHMAVPARRPSTTQTWPIIMARFAGGVHRLSLRRCSSWPRASSKQHPAPRGKYRGKLRRRRLSALPAMVCSPGTSCILHGSASSAPANSPPPPHPLHLRPGLAAARGRDRGVAGGLSLADRRSVTRRMCRI